MANEGKDPAAKAGTDVSEPAHVMELLKQFDFLSIGLGGKIHCALTKRDLPLNTVAVQQHLNSKKLKKEREWYNADFSKYEPLIVAHKTNPKLLFCTLTRKELNRIPKQVEAHVNGKRFKNRKAEMEGLKKAQRQPMKEESEEEGEGEEEEEDDANFWMPTSEADVEAMEEDGSDAEDEEEEEEEEGEEEERGAAGGRTSRRGKGRGANNKKGVQAETTSKGGRKGGKATKTAKGGAKGESDGAQENGASGVKEGKGKVEKKGGSKNKPREGGGKEAGKRATKGGKSGPLSDDTPAVSNTVTKDAGAAAVELPSPSAKSKSKAKSAKKAKGPQTPEGNGVVEGLTPVSSKSATKRKIKASEESASSGKKKRKA